MQYDNILNDSISLNIICWEILTQPVTLPCGHTICGNCFARQCKDRVDRNLKATKPGKCPNCRYYFSIKLLKFMQVNQQVERLIQKRYLPLLREYSLDVEYQERYQEFAHEWKNNIKILHDLAQLVQNGDLIEVESTPPPPARGRGHEYSMQDLVNRYRRRHSPSVDVSNHEDDHRFINQTPSLDDSSDSEDDHMNF